MLILRSDRLELIAVEDGRNVGRVLTVDNVLDASGGEAGDCSDFAQRCALYSCASDGDVSRVPSFAHVARVLGDVVKHRGLRVVVHSVKLLNSSRFVKLLNARSGWRCGVAVGAGLKAGGAPRPLRLQGKIPNMSARSSSKWSEKVGICSHVAPCFSDHSWQFTASVSNSMPTE